MNEAEKMPHREPTAPSSATIKRLFAHSGNNCAFPKCTTNIVQGNSVVGEMCHIRAKKPDGPRYDSAQSPGERHGYDNLILLCRNHHSVVDDDPEAYTVDRLAKMKKNHEEGAASIPTEVIDQGSRLLINQLVTTVNQSGGISAHTVNINSSPSTAPRVGSRVEIKRTGDREHLQFTLVTTLYNDGDAAARKVNGKWKLNISEGLPSVEKTVRMDSLPSSFPFVIDHTIGGTINNPFFSNPNVRIVLEIDLVYLGLKNTEQRYYVIYDYDTTQKTFVPASDDKVGN